MKAPVGLLSDRTVLRSKMEGLCPDKFQFAEPTRRLPQRLGFPGGVGAPRPTPYTKNVPARRVHQI